MQDLLAHYWEFGKTVSKSDDFIKLSRKLRMFSMFRRMFRSMFNASIHPTYVLVT